MIDLKRLAHVVALAEEGHFGRAAERVHLSQPAFSRSIQAIEGDLGLRLFDRGAEGAKPTPAGGFLIERARRLLFDARCLQRDATLYRDSRLGDTAFGAGPFPAAALMPRVVPALRQRHPGVALRLEIGNWPSLQQRLLAEDIEFFVADTRDIPADPRIEVAPLGGLSGHLYVRVGHPLAGRPCRLVDAAAFGIATTKLPSAVEGLLGQLSGLASGEPLGLVVQCDDMSLLRTLALQTDTVVGLPDAWARADADALVRLQLDDLPDVHAETGVVSLVNRTPSPMAQLAIACVREVATQIGKDALP